MSYLKTLNSTDIIITPFEVNKGISFVGKLIVSVETYGNSEYGTGLYGGDLIFGDTIGQNYIDRFLAVDTTQTSFFDLNTEPTTGDYITYYQKLVFNSIKQLYYSNFTTSSYGDTPVTASLIPGVNNEGDRLIGPSTSQGRYYNFPQTTLTSSRYFPTSSESTLGVLSIPSKLYGNYIQPTSFYLKFGSGSSDSVFYEIIDDGEGNLLLDNTNCGNIIYNQGIAILTQSGSVNNSLFAEDFISASNISCSFSSSLDIYETQYKCTIRANEFNYSLNPSLLKNYGENEILLSGSNEYQDFITSSDFSPYISTVGLYNDNQELLAVGKLSQPLLTSQTTDTTILINIDR